MTKGANMQEHAQYAIGWGTVSLINAGLARSKGRSGRLWWLASLFVGPLATFLVVMLPAARPAAIERDEEGCRFAHRGSGWPGVTRASALVTRGRAWACPQ
jgi:hypothetical protein